MSSLRSLSRPPGAGVGRDVSVIFGHAQLIPTYTLQPEEEVRDPTGEWRDPAQSPAPRQGQQAPGVRAQGRVAGAGGTAMTGEGDTLDRLGLAPRSVTWQSSLIKQAEPHRPMSASVRGTVRSQQRPSSSRGARSRSPSAGRHGLSKRPPLQLSSSTLVSPSSARLRGREHAHADSSPGPASLERDVAQGEFRSPHGKHLATARRYVQQLDRELQENARLALEDEKLAMQQARRHEHTGSAGDSGSSPSRKHAEWNRDLMLGVHVRAVGMERRWAAEPGAERIAALYDPARDLNASSTSILRGSSASTAGTTNLADSLSHSHLYDAADESALLERSTAPHAPASSSGAHNASYARDRETPADSMPDKVVDRGFWASGTRKHEEAAGGKTLLKTRAWPRDPLGTTSARGRAGSAVGSGARAGSSERSGGVNTSTTSARVRAQRSGDINFDLSASFGPDSSAAGVRRARSACSSPASSRKKGESFRLSSAEWASPAAKKLLLRPSSSQQQLNSSRNALSPTPYSVSHAPPHSVVRNAPGGGDSSGAGADLSGAQSGGGGLYTNPHNTSSAAQQHNPVTAASAHAQRLHAAKFDRATGQLRSHPRGFADEFLAQNGISVASGMGGLPDDEERADAGDGGNGSFAGDGSGFGAGGNQTGQTLLARSQLSQHNIEGDGSILDLSSALARRRKAPWKYGAETRTRRHDRKNKATEDFALEEARKKRLPSSARPRSASASSHSHSHAHRSGHALSNGQAQFVTGPTALKPSLQLRESGRTILGRARLTPRVELSERDWAHVKRRERAARAQAYEAAKRGPADPAPHRSSVIEEALALDKLARRERAMVAREREWRAQQIWLHEKKKGMDKLAARAAAAAPRPLPPRPRRSPSRPRAEDETDVSSGGGGLAKPWGGPLIVPAYLDSLGRVSRDIDEAAEVRGKDRLAAHARAQIAAQKNRLGDLARPHHSSNDALDGGAAMAMSMDGDGDGDATADWPSKNYLSHSQGAHLTNPLADEEEEEGGDGGQGQGDSLAAMGRRRAGEYEADELEREEARRRTQPSNRALERRAIEAVDDAELRDLHRQAQELIAGQDWRERAAERALSGSKGAPAREAATAQGGADPADSQSWAAQRDAEERSQAAQRTMAQSRRGAASSMRHPAALSFTSSPHKPAASAARDAGAAASSPSSRHEGDGEGVGAAALRAAQIYDRRLREMISFLRVRQPYWSEAERHSRASSRAGQIVAEEMRRMTAGAGRPSSSTSARGKPVASLQQQGGPDWFSEYQATYMQHDSDEELEEQQRRQPPPQQQQQQFGQQGRQPAEHKYNEEQERATHSSSLGGDYEAIPSGSSYHRHSHNPFAPQAHVPNALSDEQQLEEMRRASAEITQRYERMRQQATEAMHMH